MAAMIAGTTLPRPITISSGMPITIRQNGISRSPWKYLDEDDVSRFYLCGGAPASR